MPPGESEEGFNIGVLKRQKGFHTPGRRGEESGFDGVVTQVKGKWLYVAVADADPVGFDGI